MKLFRTSRRSGGASLAVTVALLVSSVACSAPVGRGGLHLPKDAPATCAEQCESMGMGLDSVVIMAGNVGCVCRAQKSVAAGSLDGSGAAGMAALLVQSRNQGQQASGAK